MSRYPSLILMSSVPRPLLVRYASVMYVSHPFLRRLISGRHTPTNGRVPNIKRLGRIWAGCGMHKTVVNVQLTYSERVITGDVQDTYR